MLTPCYSDVLSSFDLTGSWTAIDAILSPSACLAMTMEASIKNIFNCSS